MKLENKKSLVARTLGIGKNKIIFNNLRLDEIKEAITKQDIRDLYANGAIAIREIVGRRKVVRRRLRRKAGSIKKPAIDSKREYMTITRKLRKYVAGLLSRKQLSKENYYMLRKEIKARAFRTQGQLKERLTNLK